MKTLFLTAVRPLCSFHRLGQFSTIGLVGVVVDTLVLVTLVELGGWSPVAAKIIAAEAAIVVMFTCNERWTFAAYGGQHPRAITMRFLRSNLVRAGGVTAALLTLFVLHDLFGVWYIIANFVGIGCGFLLNYTFESLFTWKIQQGRPIS